MNLRISGLDGYRSFPNFFKVQIQGLIFLRSIRKVDVGEAAQRILIAIRFDLPDVVRRYDGDVR